VSRSFARCDLKTLVVGKDKVNASNEGELKKFLMVQQKQVLKDGLNNSQLTMDN